MNLRQVMQPRSSANGFGRRRVDREVGTRPENKMQSGKSDPRRFINAGELTGSKSGGYGSPSRDRLVYFTTCLIGHDVEVQVKNGSIYSGIFHATNAEKDFGIILKMARLIKDGSLRGQKAISESVSKAPSKILIIPAKELVQVIAKDVSITMDGLTNELQREKQQEIMLDSFISQSRNADAERELERWVPDEDDPQCPELENIFDDHWNRNWDQFETNEALFGVKSTFDEELYTTKLEKGPQMRELEREALRIAREIEAEETNDFHLAEERGIQPQENIDIDEETRYSSVLREVDDSGYADDEDTIVDLRNNETFGGSSNSAINRSLTDSRSGKSNGGTHGSSNSQSVEEAESSQSGSGKDLYRSISNDHVRQLAFELVSKNSSALDSERRIQDNDFSGQHGVNSNSEDIVEKQMSGEEAQMTNLEDSHISLDGNKDVTDKGGLSLNASAYAPASSVSSKGQEKTSSPGESSEGAVVGKTHVAQSGNSRGQPGGSTSSASDCVGVASASSGPSLSPSSSMGSLSSEKSSLNPHAKEFKLNPNAKSFVPSQTPLRPASPASEGSFYFPANVPAVPHMHGMPLGFGIGPSFPGHQPVILNTPAAAPMQTPQAYFHPNGPQYGQQMIVGHPRPVLYMPGYPPEGHMTYPPSR
ncbi:polyadenylate-binding protein-interacting protein 3-like [Malania oleifera]|uniref:polyadenylate-binding protein-interacting protein 3-like n=1 Tax=Malania oleifera TaxID=397392 RepID=UPI0025ADFC97|nr:polyadenylate-binding protein-interacting protein 3-like [Malania oleifera]XP_057977689.1 polyadenylate-binding protein-interacting protein 3-like [Malania oleifera]XP_057977690.1 polyadenylate-binding protein-interacting protein 3-like [Malania oleifera]